MKKPLLLFILCLLIFSVFGQTDLSNWITTPNGGEIIASGAGINVTVNRAVYNPNSIAIELYNGSTKVYGPYFTNPPGATINGTTILGGNYRVRVYDYSNSSKEDWSNSTFTVGPNLSSWIQTPNGGSYALNSTINLQLNTSTYNPASVSVELYKGSTLILGPYTGGATGRTIPLAGLAAGTDYKVKAYDTSIPALSDLSDNNISIIDLSNWLTNPNGGEFFILGSQLNFTANTSIYTPPSGAPSIELYKGSTKVAGPYTVGNVGSIPISSSLMPGNDYKLRIYDPYDVQKEDWSNSTFTVGPNLSSWIQTPNGGSYALNSTINLQLNTGTYSPASVSVELYKGSTLVWGPSTGGSTGRTVPLAGLAVGTDYKVKVYDTSIPTLSDFSDNSISIIDLSNWLTNPNGGEIFILGSQLNFTANTSIYTPPSGAPSIELYKGSTKVAGPYTVGNVGSIPISSSLIPGNDYKLRIYDPYDVQKEDWSNSTFTVGPNLSSWIQTPNGGAYTLNSTINLQLNTGTYNPASVSVELYKGSTLIWGPYTGSAIGRTIPLAGLAAGTDYKVKAYDTSIPALSDLSDNNISTIDLSNWLTSPNGGEFFILGSQLNFVANTSIYTPPSGAPSIELYKGSTKVAGPYTVGNVGSIPIPENIQYGNDFLIKIYDPYSPGAFDFSNNFFSVMSDQNFIKTEEILVEGVKSNMDVNSSSDKTITFSYFDGLGKSIQRISKAGSPSKLDIIQPVTYDGFGRENRSYLPFIFNVNGSYTPDSDIIDESGSFKGIAQSLYALNSANKIADDSQPFSEVIIENSPLNRILAQGSAGSNWQPDLNSTYDNPIATDHSILFAYESNNNNEVLKWTYTAPSVSYPLGLVNASADAAPIYYAEGQLYKIRTKDEHRNEIIEFKNKSGNIILKKVQLGAEYAQTYYIYDAFQNLVCVLPPEAVKSINKTPTSDYFNQAAAVKDTFLKRWAFRYSYDLRNHIIQKQVSGADPVYMVYDNRDRLVMTQDGNQRLNNQWSFTKYDGSNRPVLTGIYTDGVHIGQSDMQQAVNDYYANLTLGQAWFETFTTTTNYHHGYDDKSFPQGVDYQSIRTVTYYDSYDFKSQWGEEYDYLPAAIASRTVNGVTYVQPSEAFSRCLGQVTGSKTIVTDAEYPGHFKFLKSAVYYDDKYRAVQNIVDNDLGGIDQTTNLYDFTGKVLASKTTHTTRVVKWKDPEYTLLSANSAASMISGMGSWPKSVQLLATGTDGWMEFKVQRTEGSSAYVGFASEDGSTTFRIRVSGASVAVVEGNDVMAEYYPHNPDNVLRIERTSGTINYYVNGTLLYSSLAASNSPLRIDVFLDTFSSVQDIRTSFSLNNSSSTERIFDYDHAGRLLATHHSVNGATPVLLAANEYNELGQLVDKNLHSTDNGSTFKQSTDYRYNIRGWLTSINNADLTPGTTNDDAAGFGKDLFGMELAYEKPVTDLTTTSDVQYNGNISAITYSNNQALGAIKSNGYKYDYDPMNRLKEAEFRQKKLTWGLSSYIDAGNVAQTAQAFSETGFEYDLNGNISELKRSGAAGSQQMDDLSYVYEGNQLLSVSEKNGGDVNKGFMDGNVTGDDYHYDVNGNMTADANKNITAIAYNHLNLPEKVTKGTGDYIKYIYDATGRKLSQQVYDASNTLKKKSDYAGEYFYENDTLKLINHEEGRVVLIKEGQPIAPEYQYHLKDHLGNVRTTFTTKMDIDEMTATLEVANESEEQSKFLRYELAKKVNSVMLDHTNDISTGYAVRLNGTENERNGLARSLSVMPGDIISVEVYAKYIDTNSTNWSAALTTLMSQVTGDAAGVVVDGAGYLNSGSTQLPLTAIDHSEETGTAPMAYINYIFINRDYDPASIKLVATRITEDAAETGYVNGEAVANGKAHELMTLTETVTEPGYVYVYLSNDNLDLKGTQVEVYFDDFKVTQTKSLVIQAADYYSSGAVFKENIRETSLLNKFKYQGKEWQDDLELNLYYFEWRNYDPYILRTTTLDPHAAQYSHFSPYSWAANNPASIIDPDGRDIINSADRIIFTGVHAQAAFAFLQKKSNSTDPCKGSDCDKNKKNDSQKGLVGAPILVGKKIVKKEIESIGGGLLRVLSKAAGLTISFLLDGPEAGRGSSMTNALSEEQENRLHELQNKHMAEGLGQDEDLEYQELLEEKYPHGESPSSFQKMPRGNNQKKNQEVTSLYKEFGITDKDKQRQVHDLITGKNLTREQIKEIIKNFLDEK